MKKNQRKLRLAKRKWAPYDPRVNGVSYTMLSTFLTCREKCRLKIAGWKSKSTGLALIMGDLCHKTAAFYRILIKDKKIKTVITKEEVLGLVKLAEEKWHEQNSRADARTLENFELAAGYCRALMPMWVAHYKRDPFKRVWINVEDYFNVPIKITDKLTIPIIGLQDGVFTKSKLLRLNEIKTKSRFNPIVHSDTIHFRMQNMMYLIALWIGHKRLPHGIEYEVIRRPGLRRKTTESFEQYMKRCEDDVRDRPEWYFWRFNVMVDEDELEAALKELKGLIHEFYLWWRGDLAHYKNTEQCEQMWGACEYLGICSSNDTSQLYKIGG